MFLEATDCIGASVLQHICFLLVEVKLFFLNFRYTIIEAVSVNCGGFHSYVTFT